MIKVQFLEDAEIMSVSVTLHDPKAAAALVNAVVDSYKIEVVDAEREYAQRRFNQLADACVEKEDDIRKKREQLRMLSSDAGNADPEAQGYRLRHAYETLTILENRSASLRGKLAEVRGEYQANAALLKALDKSPISALELDPLVRNDPVADPLATELAGLKLELEAQRDGRIEGIP